MLTCKLGNEIINCYDGTHNKEQLKKWASKKILLCPVCDKPYEYCHGEVKTPYFRHLDKNECEDKYSEPETEEHLNGKRDLFEWIKKQKGVADAVLEGWIPETKQRPDIMFEYDGKKYVIEYQCSPISSEYVERHELYQAAGIIDIWILGTNKYKEKSEIGKRYRVKEIEKHTSIYYDTKGKSVISNRINLSEECVKELPNLFLCNHFDYFHEESRNNMFDYIHFNNLVICSSPGEYIAPIDILSFKNNEFYVEQKYIEEIKTFYKEMFKEKNLYQEKFAKLSDFREQLFEYYKTEYDIDFSHMPSQSKSLGFKYTGQYFGFKNIDNYPIVDFCKINYINDSACYKKLITIDVSKNDIEIVKNILDDFLSDTIKLKKEMIEFVKRMEQQRVKEHDDLEMKLKNFTDKPIYLLFKKDENKLPSNIRFKFFNGTSDDILVVMKHLYDDLKFLKKKNAKQYIFMIPRKKWRTSSTGRSQYKVWNHPSEIIADFEGLGFTVLTYNDLILELKNDK